MTRTPDATPGLKRFYGDAAVVAAPDGTFGITLDGAAAVTPGRNALAVPTRALGDAIAAEWRAQGHTVDPQSMPMTRLANTALDRVAPNRAQIVSQVAAYAASDLLCYRAVEPVDLVRRQAAAWDPLLAWARTRFGCTLRTGAGVTFVAQDAAVVPSVTAALDTLSFFRLTAVGTMAGITGSAVLAFALAEGRLGPRGAFDAAHLDELWNRERWGFDAEAEARGLAMAADLDAAKRFFDLAGD